jgi:hydroxymethylbilane synthase
MINGDVDIAVHSMKDVPPYHKELFKLPFLKEHTLDILVHKGNLDFLNESGTIAWQLRRQAQWLNKYPTHKVVDLEMEFTHEKLNEGD